MKNWLGVIGGLEGGGPAKSSGQQQGEPKKAASGLTDEAFSLLVKSKALLEGDRIASIPNRPHLTPRTIARHEHDNKSPRALKSPTAKAPDTSNFTFQSALSQSKIQHMRPPTEGPASPRHPNSSYCKSLVQEIAEATRPSSYPISDRHRDLNQAKFTDSENAPSASSSGHIPYRNRSFSAHTPREAAPEVVPHATTARAQSSTQRAEYLPGSSAWGYSILLPFQQDARQRARYHPPQTSPRQRNLDDVQRPASYPPDDLIERIHRAGTKQEVERRSELPPVESWRVSKLWGQGGPSILTDQDEFEEDDFENSRRPYALDSKVLEAMTRLSVAPSMSSLYYQLYKDSDVDVGHCASARTNRDSTHHNERNARKNDCHQKVDNAGSKDKLRECDLTGLACFFGKCDVQKP